MKKAVIVSGYFNPLHKGHIEYFKNAKSFADNLFVIVNNDFQRNLKGSKVFMDENERKLIISSLAMVDKVFISIDKDRSVKKSIRKIYDEFHDKFILLFANGGDQTNDNIPEKNICLSLGIKMIDNLGDKIQSSSWILKK